MAVVTSTTTFSFDETTRWSFYLQFDIPTVISPDLRYYLVAPELRSSRTLFGTALNIKKAIPAPATGVVLLPGAPGPLLPYAKGENGFSTQALADQAATAERDTVTIALADIAAVNSSIFPPIIQTYNFP